MRITRPLEFLALIFLALLTSACGLIKNSKPNVIVFAVDNLGVNEVLCSGENFKTICDNSVRFTHAYTTSTMSASALTSVLTGRAPQEHGLRHSGDFVSNKLELVSELAHSQNYTTLFFSGGPPVFRRLGVHQGFSYFDDYINPEGLPYRNLEASLKIFWQQLELKSDAPFFSVFYVPDLQFSSVATQNDLGETRNLSFTSQVEELDEQLEIFLKELKNQDLWDDSYVFLVGLNGPGWVEREPMRKSFNIHSGRAQVSLLAKTPSKPRDLGLNWTIDSNVTLEDLGNTLIDIFNGSKKNERISLTEAINKPKSNWPEDRVIQTESAWSEFHGFGPILFGLRQKSLLLLNTIPTRMFNSLIDRLELTPLEDEEASKLSFYKNGLAKFISENKVPFDLVTFKRNQKWQLLDQLYNPPSLEFNEAIYQDVFDEVLRTKDSSLAMILSLYLIEKAKWQDLKTLGRQIKNNDLEYLANQHLDKKTLSNNPCLSWINDKADLRLRDCDDPISVDFYNWVTANQLEDKSIAEIKKQKLLKSLKDLSNDRAVAKWNLILGLNWQINWQHWLTVKPIDILLAHPNFKDLKFN